MFCITTLAPFSHAPFLPPVITPDGHLSFDCRLRYPLGESLSVATPINWTCGRRGPLVQNSHHLIVIRPRSSLAPRLLCVFIHARPSLGLEIMYPRHKVSFWFPLSFPSPTSSPALDAGNMDRHIFPGFRRSRNTLVLSFTLSPWPVNRVQFPSISCVIIDALNERSQ